MTYWFVLVSTEVDFMIVSPFFCRECLEQKLHLKVLGEWRLRDDAAELKRFGVKHVHIRTCQHEKSRRT